MHHDVAAFQRTLDEAWASFREQLVQVHLEYVQHDPVPKPDEGKSTGAVRPRHPSVQDDVPSIKGPPQSMMPELLISRTLPSPQTVTVDGDQTESVTKAAETAEFVDSKLYLESGEEEGATTGNPVCATLTDHTSSSIKEHVEQTLRMRLGTTKKLISGQELHDAVVALGLTRYSESDVNAIVNKLAHFVRLRFEPIDKKNATKLQHSGTFSRMIGFRRDGSLSTSSREVRIDERSRAIWEWPHEGVGSVADFLFTNMSEGMSQPQHNLVPFQALAMAFAMDGDGKRIFGTSAELFRAMKEILLAGDTNRLVAELTFVRINDLAAPTQPVDPILYIEPFVALLIVSNAFILGVQTDVNWENWEGWQWIEVAFTFAFCLEILVRIRLVGLRVYLSGPESTWNYFDMFLVLAGLVDILLTAVIAESEAAAMQLLRACRLVRLTRTFRVFRLKMIKELQLMIKGLVGGLRTLCLAFALLFSVLYVIAVFATIAIGRADLTPPLDDGIQSLFATVPDSIFTAFRCYTGECTAEGGEPLAPILAARFGLIFTGSYIACYMLITLGIFNVILAVYVDITMKAARENELNAEQHERESIRVARLTRELVKKFTKAYRQEKVMILAEYSEDLSPHVSSARLAASPGLCEEDDDHIEISKELFLTVVQDRQVQRLMDDLDLPPDRANLFEALDADGSGTLHVAELVQGFLKVRGDLRKTDTVATLLATKAVFRLLEHLSENIAELQQDTATLVGKAADTNAPTKRRQSIFGF